MKIKFTSPPGKARTLRWSHRTRLALVAVVCLVYAVAHVLMYPRVGAAFGAVAAVPVGAAGWLLGPWGGLASALLLIAFIVGVSGVIGDEAFSAIARASGAGSVILVCVGIGVGWMRVLLQRVESQRSVLAGVAAGMRDGLIVFDPTARVEFANPQAQEMLGLEELPLEGRSTDEVIAVLEGRTDSREQSLAAWQHAAQQPESRPRFEFVFARPRRRVVEVELFSATAESQKGERVGVLLRDVTADRDLAQAKEDLVSMVSHELRTPLASILGFAELLLHREYERQEQREFLGLIHKESIRLTALINDFLDVQRLESGRHGYVFQLIDLPPLLSSVVASLGQDPVRSIRIDIPSTLPRIKADPDRLRQVLLNLLSNARKYSPDGGEIVVSVSHVRGVIEVAVQDRGLGIPTEAIGELFHKFARLNTGDRREIGGTGLGLVIAKNIVEGHGGRIRAESAGPGQGSRFVFTLPAASGAITSGDVLIVEDDAQFARLLTTEMEALGLSVSCAESAETASEHLARAYPRVIVLDLLLPGESGERFLERLRQQEGAHIPVVVVSVKDLEPAERQLLRDLDVTTVLRKGPSVATEAARAVLEALQPAAKHTP